VVIANISGIYTKSDCRAFFWLVELCYSVQQANCELL
jgi:hypothetical protein